MAEVELPMLGLQIAPTPHRQIAPSRRDPVGNPLVIASPDGRYTLTYAPVYHVTRLVHPTSEMFTWSYDAVGQYRFRADPDAGRTTFTYGPPAG